MTAAATVTAVAIVLIVLLGRQAYQASQRAFASSEGKEQQHETQIRDHEQRLLNLAAGDVLRCRGLACMIRSRSIIAYPGLLPEYRFYLRDGEAEDSWMTVQVTIYGYDIALAHLLDYTGAIPAPDPVDIVYNGLSYYPGSCGWKYYYRLDDTTVPDGKVRFFNYYQCDSRKVDWLVFEQFGNGRWMVSLNSRVETLDVELPRESKE